MSMYVVVNLIASSLIGADVSGIQDEATGVTHHLVPGDFAFFHVGSKVKVCRTCPSPGLSFMI